MSSPDKKQASPKEQNTGDPVGSHPVIPDGTGTALPRQQMPEVASEEYLRTMPPQSQYQMQPWVRCGFLHAPVFFAQSCTSMFLHIALCRFNVKMNTPTCAGSFAQTVLLGCDIWNAANRSCQTSVRFSLTALPTWICRESSAYNVLQVNVLPQPLCTGSLGGACTPGSSCVQVHLRMFCSSHVSVLLIPPCATKFVK